MIKAVLLDLDNTLLINPDEAFASAFLQHIDTFFARKMQYEGVSQIIRQMMRAFGEPRMGIESNWMLALRLFSAALKLPHELIQALFEEFYTGVYAELVTCTQRVKGAAELVKYLRARDIAVVIATNPIYPKLAIEQRMAWAGLPAEKEWYALITSAEVMHFAKPDAAYYAEIIARVGIEPEEALMVGDSLRNDILPAQVIGLPTFHIHGDAASPADASGTLADFSDLIADDARFQATFTARQLQPEMIAPQYRGNIGALSGLLAEVRHDFWDKRPDPAEWSILQILCHLRDSEHTHQRPRLQRIRHEDNPFIVAPRPPGPDLPLCGDDGQRIATEFAEERQKTLELIATFKKDDWQRQARHSIFGLTTLLEMAHFTAQHDRLHLNQLCQTLGRCH